jgi:uncharacterized protein with PQ loop repeat
MPNVYLSLPSNLIGRPNHLICQSVLHPVFPATFCFPFYHYMHNMVCIQSNKTNKMPIIKAKLLESVLDAAD